MHAKKIHTEMLDHAPRIRASEARKDENRSLVIIASILIVTLTLSMFLSSKSHAGRAVAVPAVAKVNPAEGDLDLMISPDIARYIETYHAVVDEYGVE